MTSGHPSSPDELCDVAVVGAGPVGLYLALRLARAGVDVVVLERQAEPFPLPRAVHYDDEIARAFAAVGIQDDLSDVVEPAPVYEWRNAAGEALLRFDWRGHGPSGWPIATMFSQPDIERVLARQLAAQPTATLLRGHDVVGIAQDVDLVTLTTAGEHNRVRARYVVGCDGARSLVRSHLDTDVTDLGFAYDWLVVDLLPTKGLSGLGDWATSNIQVCDPARPTTAVSGGPGRRRFEFMALPGETRAELEAPERVWQLLEPWGVTSAEARLERAVVYTFTACWAAHWRRDRVFIAGDAAHQMPPFAGQGMCSGIRDVANLAWKLERVLAGLSADTLLDTYTTERCAHLQSAIEQSVALGQVICVTDPAIVTQRDAAMIGGGADPAVVLPPIPPPVLGDGVVHHLPDGTRDASAGLAAAQPVITSADGRTGLWDQVYGSGLDLILLGDPDVVVGAERLGRLRHAGVRLTRILAADQPPAPGHAVDVQGTLVPHLEAAGHQVAVVRPDGYLFGAGALENAAELVDDLLVRLQVRHQALV